VKYPQLHFRLFLLVDSHCVGGNCSVIALVYENQNTDKCADEKSSQIHIQQGFPKAMQNGFRHNFSVTFVA